MVELLVPLGLFGAMVLVVGQLARLASNISLNRTLREALRSHPPSVAMLAERLDARQPWADALVGWMFIAFAIGLVLMGLFEPELEDRREILQAAIVPLVVGVTVIFYVRRVKRELVGDGSSPTAAKPPAPVVTASPVANSPPRRPASRRKS